MATRNAIGVLLVGASLAVIPSTAMAQNPSEARVAFQEGVQHFGARRFAEALVSFQRAYRIRPHPSVMVNIANCYLSLEQPLEAISWFERYLRDATGVSPEQRAQIEHTVADARQRLASLNILAVPAGAEIYIDGTSIGVAPLRGPREVAAGPHVLEARTSNGGSVQYQARVEPGRSLTITLNTVTREGYIGSAPPGANDAAMVALAPNATPPVTAPPVVVPVVTPPVVTTPAVLPPNTPPPPHDGAGDEVVTRRRAGFVPAVASGAGVAAAGLGVAIGVTLYNNRWIDEYNTLAASFEYYRTRDAARAAEYQAQGREHLRVIEENQTIATVSAVVGGIGAAFTLGALLFWPRETVHVRRGATLHLVPTLNGISLGGAF